MKKSQFLFLCLPLLIFSCKKNGPSAPAVDATQFYVASVRSYTPSSLGIDSFTYSSSKLLTRYVQYSYDYSTGSTISDSLVFDFVYNGASTVPATYNFSQPSQGTNEVHQLTYDGQNRVTKDLCPARSDFFINYAYPGNNLAAVVQFSASGFLDNQIDTLLFSNGNMSSEQIYFPNAAGTGDSLEGTLHISYSAYGNPIYHPQIGGTIGHLLFILSFDGYQNFVDFNSKKLQNSVTDIEAGLPPSTLNYNITTDSKGRVSELISPSYPASAYRITYSYY